MNPFAIGAFITGILAAFFGVFVYFKNRKRPENQIFGVMSLSLTIWAINFGFWQMTVDKTTAFLFVHLLMIGSIFIPIFYIHYILTLLNLVQEKKKFLIIGYLITLIFLLFNFTPYMVRDLRPVLSFPYWPEGGVLFHVWLLWFLITLSYGLYILIKKLGESKGIKREQIKYVILASSISFGGGLTIFPLWYKIPCPPIGIFVIFLYPLILAYAILRYRFMDIRLVLGRGAIYALSFITIIALAFLLIFLSNQFASNVPFNITGPLILIISILLFQPVFRFFEKLASKYFYYTFYSYQAVLTDLGRKLTQFLDLDKLSSLIVSTLMNTMKLDKTVVLLREPGDGEYIIQKNIGFREENGISLVKDNFLTVWLERTQKPLVYEEISLIIRDTTDKEEKERLEQLKSNMKRIEAALCLPLFLEEKIIGMIVLGNKLSGEPYSTQDIELLTNLANQASIALQNAKLYSEVKGFSKKLEREVEKATKELKEAYEELKALDKAKSEFISIASHQLRTPLTAIKGYISMMLEKTYGKPPEKMERPLKNIYTSNERLIKLVNDLLNVSRIEAGRMEMELEKLSLEEIITSVVEELKNIVRNKDIYLKFEKPEKALPKILADREKIRQVIMNVIDNAIRYTEQGGITVKIKDLKSKIQIVVSDTGTGLTKYELSKMFESFSRGAAGTKLYTEGVGLGLYVAKRFVEMHNGKIWAESKGRDKGSTFYIELPLKESLRLPTGQAIK